MENIDTRVQYTKAVLKKALLAILTEKPVNRVTVKEVCDKAKINRGTFYLHYSSPYDLLKEIENDFITDHLEFFSPYLKDSAGEKDVRQLAGLFQCILENPDLCRILMGPNGDPQFMISMRKVVKEGVLDEWQKEFPHYAREDLSFVFEFVFPGATNLILQWIEDSRGVSVDELALRLDRLGHYCHMAIEEFHGKRKAEKSGRHKA